LISLTGIKLSFSECISKSKYAANSDKMANKSKIVDGYSGGERIKRMIEDFEVALI